MASHNSIDISGSAGSDALTRRLPDGSRLRMDPVLEYQTIVDGRWVLVRITEVIMDVRGNGNLIKFTIGSLSPETAARTETEGQGDVIPILPDESVEDEDEGEEEEEEEEEDDDDDYGEEAVDDLGTAPNSSGWPFGPLREGYGWRLINRQWEEARLEDTRSEQEPLLPSLGWTDGDDDDQRSGEESGLHSSWYEARGLLAGNYERSIPLGLGMYADREADDRSESGTSQEDWDDYLEDQGPFEPFEPLIRPCDRTDLDEDGAAMCAVCREDVVEGSDVAEMACPGKHWYCVPCAEEWLRENKTCPNCRFRLV